MTPIVRTATTPVNTKRDETSVYLYFDEYDVLLYVGITNRRDQRQHEHNGSKNWWAYVGRQTVEHHPDRQSAAARESELIRQHRPPFNRQQNAGWREAQEVYLMARRILGDPIYMRKSIYVDVATRDLGKVSLRSRLEDVAITTRLDVPTNSRIRSSRRGGSIGQVAECIHAGPLLVINANVRHAVEFAQLRIDVKWKCRSGGEHRPSLDRICPVDEVWTDNRRPVGWPTIQELADRQREQRLDELADRLTSAINFDD